MTERPAANAPMSPEQAPIPDRAPATAQAAASQTLDVHALSRRHNGDREFIAQIYELFLSDSERKEHDLRRALETKDEFVAGRLTHSLRGAAGAIYAHVLREACQQVEERMRAMEPDVRAQWPQVLATLLDGPFRVTLAEVRRALKSI